jgi:hypothetical protein
MRFVLPEIRVDILQTARNFRKCTGSELCHLGKIDFVVTIWLARVRLGEEE